MAKGISISLELKEKILIDIKKLDYQYIKQVKNTEYELKVYIIVLKNITENN